MKTPRDRAFIILHGVLGAGFSTSVFKAMVEDKTDRGASLREWLSAIENGIEQDREDVAKSLAPS